MLGVLIPYSIPLPEVGYSKDNDNMYGCFLALSGRNGLGPRR